MSDAYVSIKEKARLIRKHIVCMAHRGKTSHVGSALSCVEILSILYFYFLKIDPKAWNAAGSDKFILSKGHAAMAWYAVLAEAGFFPIEQLSSYALDGSLLGEHPVFGIPGVTYASGSLGHGLSVAAGIAYGQKVAARTTRTFALISDGECNEGSIWEAAMWSGHHHLENLIVFIDDNNMQAMGQSRQISGLDPLMEKWQAFGWDVYIANGHDVNELIQVTSKAMLSPDKPKMIIAKTVLGKGVSFMENQLGWHYQLLSDDQLDQALEELEVAL